MYTIILAVPVHCHWLTRPLKWCLWQLYGRKSPCFSKMRDSLAHLKHGLAFLLIGPKSTAPDLLCVKTMSTVNCLSFPVQTVVCFLLDPKTTLADGWEEEMKSQTLITRRVIFHLMRVWCKTCWTRKWPRRHVWLDIAVTVFIHMRRPFIRTSLNENPSLPLLNVAIGVGTHGLPRLGWLLVVRCPPVHLTALLASLGLCFRVSSLPQSMHEHLESGLLYLFVFRGEDGDCKFWNCKKPGSNLALFNVFPHFQSL